MGTNLNNKFDRETLLQLKIKQPNRGFVLLVLAPSNPAYHVDSKIVLITALCLVMHKLINIDQYRKQIKKLEQVYCQD